jgi:DNA-binding GntR family transcriptional regulator
LSRRGEAVSGDFAAVVARFSSGYKTLGQMTYEVLREAVLSGALAPGEWLRQDALAEAIGVSRVPIRTALMQLESDGLVTFHPRRGAQVRTLTPVQIDEIYRVRTQLEIYALRLSMTAMTPRRLESLRALAKGLDRAHGGPDFLQARIAFYRELYDAGSNPILLRTIEDLRGSVGHYLVGLRKLAAGHQHHHAIVEFVAARDLAGAEQWLLTHLADVRHELELLTSPLSAPRAVADSVSAALAI